MLKNDTDKAGARRCGSCRNYGHYKSKCPYLGTILGQGFNFISGEAAAASVAANATSETAAAPASAASSESAEATASGNTAAKKRGRKTAQSAAAESGAEETIEIPSVSAGESAADAAEAEHNLLTHTSASSADPAEHAAQRSKKLRPTSERTTGTHTPQHVTALAAEKSISGVNKYRRRVCAVCRKESSFICVQCKVGLHIGCDDASNCWRTYHSEEWA